MDNARAIVKSIKNDIANTNVAYHGQWIDNNNKPVAIALSTCTQFVQQNIGNIGDQLKHHLAGLCVRRALFFREISYEYLSKSIQF